MITSHKLDSVFDSLSLSESHSALSENRELLRREIAQFYQVNDSMVLPASDRVELLQALLGWLPVGESSVHAFGHVHPDVLLAASRADWDVDEILGANPFVGTIDLSGSTLNETSVVYVANPNPVTGVSYGLGEIRSLVERVPEGLVVVDETLGEFLGISAVPLLREFGNVCVLRSLSRLYSVDSDRTCALIANSILAVGLEAGCPLSSITTTQVETQQAAIENRLAAEQRLLQVREEALRVATRLGRLGAQCRITPTDFVLVRVADPTRVGNFLAGLQVRVENLDGYPHLEGYLKYQLLSPTSNNALLGGFDRMPREYYRLSKADLRRVKLTRSADNKYKTQSTTLVS